MGDARGRERDLAKARRECEGAWRQVSLRVSVRGKGCGSFSTGLHCFSTWCGQGYPTPPQTYAGSGSWCAVASTRLGRVGMWRALKKCRQLR